MDKFLIIKIFKKRANTSDVLSRVITVTFNTSKVHGGYRFDKVGIYKYVNGLCFCYINTFTLGYWLNRGVSLKTKVSWFLGMMSKYEINLK